MIKLNIGDRIQNEGDIYILCLDDNEVDLYLKPTFENVGNNDEI